jgi:hypothetical protein
MAASESPTILRSRCSRRIRTWVGLVAIAAALSPSCSPAEPASPGVTAPGSGGTEPCGPDLLRPNQYRGRPYPLCDRGALERHARVHRFGRAGLGHPESRRSVCEASAKHSRKQILRGGSSVRSFGGSGQAGGRNTGGSKKFVTAIPRTLATTRGVLQRFAEQVGAMEAVSEEAKTFLRGAVRNLPR